MSNQNQRNKIFGAYHFEVICSFLLKLDYFERKDNEKKSFLYFANKLYVQQSHGCMYSSYYLKSNTKTIKAVVRVDN